MGTIKVDKEKCKGCGLCVQFCPRKVVGLSSELNGKGYHPAELKDEERCTGCAICATMCPDVAIEVWR
jgi:2-oxoglutarate ferredoxin oxidoreductase subunit delta